MASKKNEKIQKKLKIILRLSSGKLKETDELVQEAIITGKGSIWCYDPFDKTVVKLERGINVYILQEKYDSNERTLIYCTNGDILCIEPEELIMIGFN
jgi:hypothetical protein